MSKLELSDEILEALQRLSSLLGSEDALDRTLQTVVDLSVATLPGCDSAGVTIRRQGKHKTAAASDHFTLEIDKIQYDAGDGPCVVALATGEPQRIEAVAEDTRWPEFSGRAAGEGLKSVASFPLRMSETPGALNLYARTERAFDELTSRIAEIFAKQASIAIQNAELYTAARRLGDQLNEALHTRDLIGQAKGILMEREGLSDEDAFEMLKTLSQHSNVKLREVARRVVEDRLQSRG